MAPSFSTFCCMCCRRVKRIQHYRLLSPARKKERLAVACRELKMPPPQVAVMEPVADFLSWVARLESVTLSLTRLIGRLSSLLSAQKPSRAGSLHATRLTPGDIALKSPQPQPGRRFSQTRSSADMTSRSPQPRPRINAIR